MIVKAAQIREAEEKERKKVRREEKEGPRRIGDLGGRQLPFTLAAALLTPKANGMEEGPNGGGNDGQRHYGYEFSIFMAAYTIFVVLFTVMVMMVWQMRGERMREVERLRRMAERSRSRTTSRGSSVPTDLDQMQSIQEDEETERRSEGSDRAMTRQEFHDFVMRNREDILRLRNSMPEGIPAPRPPQSSSSSTSTRRTDEGIQGDQEETPQRMPDEDWEEEMALAHEDVQGESEEPTEDRSLSQEPQVKGQGKGEGEPHLPRGMGVFVTRFGARYHLFRDCQTLQNSMGVRQSPPCSECSFSMRMIYAARGEPLWCLGTGQKYHAESQMTRACSTGTETKYQICGWCQSRLREHQSRRG